MGVTLPETNSSNNLTENWWLEDDISFPIFRGELLVLGSVIF